MDDPGVSPPAAPRRGHRGRRPAPPASARDVHRPDAVLHPVAADLALHPSAAAGSDGAAARGVGDLRCGPGGAVPRLAVPAAWGRHRDRRRGRSDDRDRAVRCRGLWHRPGHRAVLLRGCVGRATGQRAAGRRRHPPHRPCGRRGDRLDRLRPGRGDQCRRHGRDDQPDPVRAVRSRPVEPGPACRSHRARDAGGRRGAQPDCTGPPRHAGPQPLGHRAQERARGAAAGRRPAPARRPRSPTSSGSPGRPWPRSARP